MSWTYTTDNLISSVDLNSMGNGNMNYHYTTLDRLGYTTHTMRSGYPNDKLRTIYYYLYGSTNSTGGSNSTGLIRQINFNKLDSSSGSDVVTANHGQLNYTYDANGNILTISENSVLKATYTGVSRGRGFVTKQPQFQVLNINNREQRAFKPSAPLFFTCGNIT